MKEDRDIVFYAERKGHYPFFEGIIKELLKQHNRTISYITSDPHDPVLKTTEAKIKPFYIRSLLPIFFSLVNCRVFVMTLTDLNQLHLKRSIHPVHYVYVFHTLASTHMGFRFGSYDHYDSILCPGPQQLKEIRKHEELYKLRRKQLVKGGYYRLEQLYDEYHNYKKERRKGVKGTVLVAPSWGNENILESCGEKLVKLLLDSNYHVIVRPHSETIKQRPEIIEKLKKLYLTHPHFALELSGHKNDSLLKADVLISDYSGIAFVYAFGTERPVLFLDVPKKVKNPKYKELGMEPLELSLRSQVGAVLLPEDIDKVPGTVEKLIKNKASYKSRAARLRKKYIYAFGKSAQAGAQHILEMYRKKMRE